MRKCPRCSCEVSESSKACPKCGLATVKMEAFEKSMSNMEFDSNLKKTNPNEYLKLSRAEKKALKREKKLKKKAEKKAKRIRESVSDTDFSVFAMNTDEYRKKIKSYQNNFFGRRQRSKDRSKTPEFTIDPNGEFNIDTSDVELVGEQTGRMLEEQHQSYSIKKSRGDYRPPKIKWWEIYKLADRHFARRKIKKQINKAAKIKPGFISKAKLFVLSLLFGWLGAHNFYAKNYKKGTFSIVTLFLFIFIVSMGNYSPFFASISVSIGGFCGFLNLFIWISDTINIGLNTFKYRIQKEGFLFRLNFNTRAKLGEKYYDLELYQKPFWTRFAVWCKKRKRSIDEMMDEHRQNKIAKQKKKQEKAKAAEMQEGDVQVANSQNPQKNENVQGEKQTKTKREKIEDDARNAVDQKTIRELNSFDGGKTEAGKSEEIDYSIKPKKQAKVKVTTKKSNGSKKKK